MKKSALSFLTTVILCLLGKSVYSQVRLPAIISSNMVLQRNSTVLLWGWANTNEKISIKTSWLKDQVKLEANQEGNWRIGLKTTNSKAPQTIKIISKTSDITLKNILFGEVWLCSGQSNMTQPVKGFIGQPTFGSIEAVAKSNNPNLRLFTVDRIGSKTPLKDAEKYIGWQQATPESVTDFSAIGYFFGQQLQEILEVPVGIIHSSWGGSLIEAWMSKEALSPYQNINIETADLTKSNRVQTALFNAMIHPLIPYTIKGVLWYQGEGNSSKSQDYKKLFPSMVKDWRNLWGIGDFPFYYVQIAPFMYANKSPLSTSGNTAFMREAQLQCLDLIPNSGIAITMDIGDKYSIHPPKKKEVADRLLFNALHQSYGYKTVDFAGPIFDSLRLKDSGIILKFKNAETGLYSPEELSGFEIAGDDRMFYPAAAKILNFTDVFVRSDKVTNPLAVRYAWRNWVVGNLYDTNLLPASSFRTDDWDDATHFDK